MIGGTTIKALLGPKWTTWARTVTRGLEHPSWGNLRRVKPLSETYGFDRGTPIDRYYVDKFLSARAALICGRILEIQTTDHARRYGTGATVMHTLDINAEAHGNCLAAAAAMHGIAVEELTAAELDATDPRYPVLVTIECRIR